MCSAFFHGNIQNTQNNTKSSIQLGQLIQGQPQSPKFTKPYKPESQSQIQIFKQYRDENDITNITPSSAGIETIAKSNDYQTAIDLIQQSQLYDLDIIMKTKAYKNDAMQKIISQQNPQLGIPENEKFIIGATTIPMNQDIKQEFIQNYQNVYEKAKQITGKMQSQQTLYIIIKNGTKQYQDTQQKTQQYKQRNYMKKELILTIHISRNQQIYFTDIQEKFAEKPKLKLHTTQLRKKQNQQNNTARIMMPQLAQQKNWQVIIK
ncbi:hypothetical protein ABPG72_013990 [Tetrahymena utriculariae]